jgi:CDP-6-deoxy-D-xylo-4-hexulose-3-dehydrase
MKIVYPLATSTWDEKEIKALHRVIESNHYTMGKYVKEFESDFADYFGSKYAVMVNSGSSANLLAVSALFYTNELPALKRGDEVIVPAVSWSTTYSPLHQYGLKQKYVDIDIDTLNYNLEELEKAITPKTRLIIAVNILGNPNEFKKIQELCDHHKILLLEDNCESMGAKYNDRYTGTFGEMGTFSTFFSHHMATMEGGVVVTDNTELYHILLSLRSHGWTRHLPGENLVTGKKSDVEFDELFKFVLPGYNLRPLEMSAAVGIEQLKKLPSFISQRIKNADHFVSLFKDDKRFIIQREIAESSWFGFSLILKEKDKRNELVAFLRERGIEVRPVVSGNFTKNPVMKYYQHEIHGDLINTNNLDENSFFVGNNQNDITGQIDYLKENIDLFF